MEELKPYNIGFSGLSNGIHHFSFDIGPDFFSCFPLSEIEEGFVKLELTLEKEENMLVFDFRFSGYVDLECDRCLDCFSEPVEHQHTIYVKPGDEFSEQSEDVVVIPYGESHFDVAHYVYEFLHLMLPLRRVHPDDDAGESACNKEMLERVQYLSPDNHPSGTHLSDGHSPFELLKKLRFNKEN